MTRSNAEKYQCITKNFVYLFKEDIGWLGTGIIEKKRKLCSVDDSDMELILNIANNQNASIKQRRFNL